MNKNGVRVSEFTKTINKQVVVVVARSLLSCMGTKHTFVPTTVVINSRPNGSVHLFFNHFSHISTVLRTH